jgi:hypothetical protein
VTTARDLALQAGVAGSNLAPPTTSDVVNIPDPTATPPPGSSTLNRISKAISMDLHTSGLPAGDAVTIWWMVFNHPRNRQDLWIAVPV